MAARVDFGGSALNVDVSGCGGLRLRVRVRVKLKCKV